MISLDVETTGLSERENSVIEIGAVDMMDPSRRLFIDCQAILGYDVSEFALKVNGHTMEDIYDSSKPSQDEAIRKFDEWISDISEVTLIGENPRFDLNFMNQMYSNSGMKSPLGYRSIDLHTTTINNLVSRGEEIPLKGKVSAVNGDWIMGYVGIPCEPKPHQGLNGALFEAEAYYRLVFGEKLLPEFEDFQVPSYLRK